MATQYTTDDVLTVRRYQAVCAANTYIQFVCKKDKYGGASSCMKKKMVLLTQWVDILLRYDAPSTAAEELLNCLTEAQIDHILEQISKMTGAQFYGKETVWEFPATITTVSEPWQWNTVPDESILWNDNDAIDTNIIL